MHLVSVVEIHVLMEGFYLTAKFDNGRITALKNTLHKGRLA
jgi:hypothetical protein